MIFHIKPGNHKTPLHAGTQAVQRRPAEDGVAGKAAWLSGGVEDPVIAFFFLFFFSGFAGLGSPFSIAIRSSNLVKGSHN